MRLGAVQAQDHAGALWSIALRTTSATRLDVERAVGEGAIVRTWPMRGTLHYVPAADARWMLELLSPRIMKGAAGRHRHLELDDAAFRRSRTLITRALARQPVLSRTALYAVLDRGGVSTVGQRGIHILQRLCMECMLVYGPHEERQPTFTMFDRWIPSSHALDRDEAMQTLATRYFTSHGPASVRDFIWWTGLTVADAKRAVSLASPSLERLEGDGMEMWAAADRIDCDAAPQGAHLLPGFDELMLGYRDRSAALPARYASRVVPGGNGMFLSTVVLAAQVRGTWRRAEGSASVTVACVPFTRLTAAQRRCFEVPANRYARYLGMPVDLRWQASDFR